MNRLSIVRVGTALGAALGLSFAACVAWDAVFPAWKMYPFWRSLLPGFRWISVGGFFLGLAESVLLGFWGALVFVPLYNLMGSRVRGSVRAGARPEVGAA